MIPIGWTAAGAGVCMIEMAVGWISDGGLSAFLRDIFIHSTCPKLGLLC